ncbi:MAG: hypothetical protein LBJ64_00615 [Deltaproteobacteria bacterium]|jgi:hypothetical protein|nr:hypothetical protein [Deltaproteobacteria bacterium]
MSATRLPLRLAKEICQKLLERRLLSAAKLPETLKRLGDLSAELLLASPDPPILSLAGDLVLRLVERGRLGTSQAAGEALSLLTEVLSQVNAELPAHKSGAALKSSVDLSLKLLETNAAGPDHLPEIIRSLAFISADLLPDEEQKPKPAEKKAEIPKKPAKRR